MYSQPTATGRSLWRWLATLLLAAAGALLLWQIGSHAFRGYRLDHHGVTVDAKILDSDVGCFGAIGGGSTSIGGSTITYTVRFRTDAGLHVTDVTRPCRVIPPDFGRGRGAIWVQYDSANPDRVRVVNDNSDVRAVQILSVVGGIYLAALMIIVLVRRRRRRSGVRP